MNAADERMLGGGGVDGAIHRAAGPKLLQACEEVPEVSPGVRCPTGETRLLPGFGLPAKYVINTVGPIYEDEKSSAPLLKAAIENSLKEAKKPDIQSIAFPGISCGVFGYPAKEAALLTLKTTEDCLKKDSLGLERVVFALFSTEMFQVWTKAATDLGWSMQKCSTEGEHYRSAIIDAKRE